MWRQLGKALLIALGALLAFYVVIFLWTASLFRPTHPDLNAVAEHTRLSFPKSAVLVGSWHREPMIPTTMAAVRMSRDDVATFRENDALAGQWEEPGEETDKGEATNASGGALEWWNPDAAEDYIVANVRVPRDPNAPPGTPDGDIVEHISVLIDLDDPDEAVVYIFCLTDN